MVELDLRPEIVVPLTPEQIGNLHAWDIYIDILDQRIQEAKRGLTWREKWENISKANVDNAVKKA